jgi:hypothetical protein
VNTSASSRSVSWSVATVTDNVDDDATITYTKPTGSTFDVGSSTTVGLHVLEVARC